MPQAWTVRFPAVTGGQLWTEGDRPVLWQGSPWGGSRLLVNLSPGALFKVPLWPQGSWISWGWGWGTFAGVWA